VRRSHRIRINSFVVEDFLEAAIPSTIGVPPWYNDRWPGLCRRALNALAAARQARCAFRVADEALAAWSERAALEPTSCGPARQSNHDARQVIEAENRVSKPVKTALRRARPTY
jgi:hypothetical protein